MVKFRIKAADTAIWNESELVDFLIANQNQHIAIENGTEGCCARAVGLYHWLDKFNFKSVLIETSNILETHPVYRIKHLLAFKFLDAIQPISPELHVWNKKKIFCAIYGRPLWHRLGLMSYLQTHYPDQSLVNSQMSWDNEDARKLFELDQLWTNHPASVFDLAHAAPAWPCVLEEIENYTPGAVLTDGFVAQTQAVYPNILIDIVAETFTSGNCFFATEKTVRPMLLKKPFIQMAAVNSLCYLRQLGFRTFHDFWDESYDGYSGAERYKRILALLDDLAQKSTAELEQLYWAMTYTLDHNYDLLQSKRFKRKITQL